MRSLAVVLLLLLPGCFGSGSSSENDRESSSSSTSSGAEGSVQLREIAVGFSQPLLAIPVPGSLTDLVVVEQSGSIKLLQSGVARNESYLDIKARVESGGSEQGLLGFAFHPNFTQNGVAIVSYTRPVPANPQTAESVVSRFRLAATGAALDAGSEEVLLTLAQPFANHNGGHIVYGPDGFLYVGFGDGGAAGDPGRNGQNPATWLGSILRIDVGADGPYRIPSSNPFVGQSGAAPETWSYGWRNPWRFTFDSATGDMWIGDVGQDLYEEIDYELAGTGGRNYGWALFEGKHHYPSLADVVAPLPGYTFPVAEYTHNPHCSVTGGPVYRGSAIPGLVGANVYGDFCSGTIWRLNGPTGQPSVLLELGGTISSFGLDSAGEILVLDYAAGRLLRLTN